MRDRLLPLLAVATMGLAVTAALREPVAHGDSGEYFLMAEALANHGTPQLHPEDVSSLAVLGQRQPMRGGFGALMSELQQTADHRFYAMHFWGYPLVTLPWKLVLRVFGANEFKAPQLTNATLLVAASWFVFLARGPSTVQRRWAAVLGLVGPPAWFCVWPHPEVFCYGLVLAGLVLAQLSRLAAGTACVAVAAMQNPPLVLLAATIAAMGYARLPAEERGRGARGLAIALSPALFPPAFYLWRFGRPSLIAPEGMALAHATPGKALELVFDLDLGLLPYVPGAVLLAIVATFIAVRKGRPDAVLVGAAWLLVFAVGLACATTANWNHGTSGPSRYAVWLLPVLVLLAARLSDTGAGRVTLVVALGAQTAIVAARAGTWGQEDHHRHSYLARLVLERWPAAYDPSHEIFTARTPQLGAGGPFLYEDDAGCRKALAQKRHALTLAQRCGALPPDYQRWREQIAADDRGRDRWTYVNW